MKTFEIITKKNKRKHLLKTAVLATLGSSAALLALNFGLSELTARNGQHVRDYYQLMAEVSQPNIDYKTAYFNPTSQYTGTFHVDQTKDIAGIEVPYETLELPYSLRPLFGGQSSGGYSDKKGTATYTYGGGYKMPHFFNTAYQYKGESYHQLTQDISLLPQMSGQAVEMAVTFDKPYTFEEIAELVPNNLKINWYWIGTQSNNDTAGLNRDLFGFEGDPDTPSSYQQQQEDEKNTKGMTAEEIETYYKDRVGQKTTSAREGFANSYSFFVAYLNQVLNKGWLGSTYGGPDGEQMSTSKDVETYLKANPDAQTAKFAGVILTGRAENFSSLEKADWIFGSNIGHHVQIQPYHTLDVE
ncbi:anti sigma factor C-terminal domain-containing protein [Streptococcus sp. E17BB]|uniref:anti sigma factor C-terminal domain-containing protein n=1 Tax=Streptococcus sp. E17BB TaxID=3278714 RepID=UPI00359D6733